MWLFKKKTQDNVGPKSQVDRHCSFCAKDQAEVAKLIAGPNVYICDECVDLCNDILLEENTEAEAPSGKARPIAPTGLSCGLCHFPVEVGGFITVPDRGPLWRRALMQSER
jgi:hypothetical protein